MVWASVIQRLPTFVFIVSSVVAGNADVAYGIPVCQDPDSLDCSNNLPCPQFADSCPQKCGLCLPLCRNTSTWSSSTSSEVGGCYTYNSTNTRFCSDVDATNNQSAFTACAGCGRCQLPICNSSDISNCSSLSCAHYASDCQQKCQLCQNSTSASPTAVPSPSPTSSNPTSSMPISTPSSTAPLTTMTPTSAPTPLPSTSPTATAQTIGSQMWVYLFANTVCGSSPVGLLYFSENPTSCVRVLGTRLGSHDMNLHLGNFSILLRRTLHNFSLEVFQTPNCTGLGQNKTGNFGSVGLYNSTCVIAPTGVFVDNGNTASLTNLSWLVESTNNVNMTAYLTESYGGSCVRNCTAEIGCASVSNTTAIHGYQETPLPSPPTLPTSMFTYQFIGATDCAGIADVEVAYTVANGSCIVHPSTTLFGYLPAYSQEVYRMHPSSRGFQIVNYFNSTNCSGPATLASGNFGTTCATMNFSATSRVAALSPNVIPVAIQAFLVRQPNLASSVHTGLRFNFTGNSWVTANENLTLAPTPAPSTSNGGQLWAYLYTNSVCGDTPVALNIFPNANSRCVSVRGTPLVPHELNGTFLQSYSVQLSREHTPTRIYRLKMFSDTGCIGNASEFTGHLGMRGVDNSTCVTIPMAVLLGTTGHASSVNVSWLVGSSNDESVTRQLCSTYGGQDGVIQNCTAGEGCTRIDNSTSIAGYQATASPQPVSRSNMIVLYYFNAQNTTCTSRPTTEVIYTVANGACILYPASNFTGGYVPPFSHQVYRLHPSSRGYAIVTYPDSTNCSGSSVSTEGHFGSCHLAHVTEENMTSMQLSTLTAPFMAFTTVQKALASEVPAGRVFNYTGSGWMRNNSSLTPSPHSARPLWVYIFPNGFCGNSPTRLNYYPVANGSCIVVPAQVLMPGNTGEVQLAPYSVRITREFPVSQGLRVLLYNDTSCSSSPRFLIGMFGIGNVNNSTCVRMSQPEQPSSNLTTNVSWLVNAQEDVGMTEYLATTFGGNVSIRNCTTLQGCVEVTNATAIVGYQASASNPVQQSSTMVVYYFESTCGVYPDAEVIYTVANGSCITYPRQSVTAELGYIVASSGRVFRNHPSSRGFRVVQYLDSLNCTGPAFVSEGSFGSSTCARRNFTMVHTGKVPYTTSIVSVPYQAFLSRQPTLALQVSPYRVYNYTGSAWVEPPQQSSAPSTPFVTHTPTSAPENSSGTTNFAHGVVIAAVMGCILAISVAVFLLVRYIKRIQKNARTDAFLALADDPTFKNDTGDALVGSSYPFDEDDGDETLMVMEPIASPFSDGFDNEDDAYDGIAQYEDDNDAPGDNLVQYEDERGALGSL
eukprot:m.26544 g.26544  ORF g.26544 m.26544 type:complete len:1326 (+) comp6328_c0_seq1:420-4397(+)